MAVVFSNLDESEFKFMHLGSVHPSHRPARFRLHQSRSIKVNQGIEMVGQAGTEARSFAKRTHLSGRGTDDPAEFASPVYSDYPGKSDQIRPMENHQTNGSHQSDVDRRPHQFQVIPSNSNLWTSTPTQTVSAFQTLPTHFPLATASNPSNVGKRPVGASPVPRGVFTSPQPSPV